MLPLSHFKVIELSGLAPVPLCGMILSDFGAKVVRIENSKENLNNLDTKIFHRDKQRDLFTKFLRNADVLLDPYRPGVLEKLNFSPLELHKVNPKLIIARLTGYGQPHSTDSFKVARQKLKAGHDINYLALSGVLSTLGPQDPDVPLAPVNLLADFGGGAFNCVFGIILSLLNREKTGKGEIIDCSMTLGASYLSSFLWQTQDKLSFIWPQPTKRRTNLLDGGAPFYRCYRTKDDRFVAVGALEPQFYSCLLKVLEMSESDAPQFDYESWQSISVKFADIFITKSQSEWVTLADKYDDCCLTPVLDLEEAGEFWKGSFIKNNGKFEPKPHPLFANIKSAVDQNLVKNDFGDIEKKLLEFGINQEEVSSLLKANVAKL